MGGGQAQMSFPRGMPSATTVLADRPAPQPLAEVVDVSLHPFFGPLPSFYWLSRTQCFFVFKLVF